MLKLVTPMTFGERLQEAQNGLLEQYRRFWNADGSDARKFNTLPEVRIATSAPASIGSLNGLIEGYHNAWKNAGCNSIMFATDADVLRAASVLAEAGAY